jgi:lipid II:glycine glycyltransferase (peptidoglycan interpeptide bridge formation enzyme)
MSQTSTTGSSLWQSPEWKSYQESLGRETRVYGARNDSGELEASALCVIDRTLGGLSVWDIPRGPVGASKEAILSLLEHVVSEARKDKCMAIYYSPFEVTSYKLQVTSSRHEQPEATVVLDLNLSDEELLSQMKQKGRYNISVATKRGVIVRESKDIDSFYKLLSKTGKRDKFGIKPKGHYEKFMKELPGSFLLLAFLEDVPVAGLMGTTWGTTGYYYYGASDYEHRSSMAPYLLQAEAMKHCRSKGCEEYDLLGIAPNDDPSHHFAGITRFKKQFGGEVITYPPEREIVLKPITKKLLAIKRAIFK